MAENNEPSEPHTIDAFMNLIDANPENFQAPEHKHTALKKEAPASNEDEDRDAPSHEDLSVEDEDQKETDSEEATDDESEDSNTNEDDSEEEEYVTVKVNGKSYEIPKSLEAGIMKDEDYSRKTMALAEEKKLLDQHLNSVTAERHAVNQERTAYKQKLEEVANAIGQAKKQEPNWQQLLDENPTEFVKQRYLFDELKKHEDALVQEYRGVLAKQNQEFQQRLHEEQQVCLAKLREWEPTWKDNDVKMATDMRKAADRAIAKGFATEQDFLEANDPRTLIAFYQAWKFENDQLTNTVSQVKAQAVKSKSLPAGSSGQSTATRNNSFKKDLERLQKSGGRDRQAGVDAFKRFV